MQRCLYSVILFFFFFVQCDYVLSFALKFSCWYADEMTSVFPTILSLLGQDHTVCFGVKLGPPDAAEIKFSDIYAVELIDRGLVHRSNPKSPARCLLGHEWQVDSPVSL